MIRLIDIMKHMPVFTDACDDADAAYQKKHPTLHRLKDIIADRWSQLDESFLEPVRDIRRSLNLDLGLDGFSPRVIFFF